MLTDESLAINPNDNLGAFDAQFVERARVVSLFIAANRHCQAMTGGSLTDRTGWEVPCDDECEVIPTKIPSSGKALAMIQYYLEGSI